MRVDARGAEEGALMRTAQAMCAAARTAPKARGIDHIETCILTGKEKDDLADEMDKIGDVLKAEFFHRDAQNVRDSYLIVMIGIDYSQRGLSEICQLCNNRTCDECAEKNAVCIYDPLDLGIALGSAVSIAADDRMDNRILFSAGKAALVSGTFPDDIRLVMGIPLSCTGKSPYFDRKKKK